jgi:circadian clock protein KaiB
MDQYRLKLYVTGRTPRSQQAIDNLQRMLDEGFSDRYELEIIDVLESPQEAEAHKVLATPTLVKELPPPLRRVIGDLSDSHQVLLGLDLEPLPGNSKGGSQHG